MGVVTGTHASRFPAVRLRSPACTACECNFIFVALFPFPSGPILRVFEDDALFEELCADFIGCREIARFLGGRALGDEPLNLGIGNPARLFRRFQHLKDIVKTAEYVAGSGEISGTEFTRIERRVGLAKELEYRGQRFSRIEVVVHGLAESEGRVGCVRGYSFVCSCRELRGIQTELEIAQSLNRS